MPFGYERASAILEEFFATAESYLLQSGIPEHPGELDAHFDTLFQSSTQAYREVFLGCLIARILDKDINIRQPYLDQGPHSFSGRSLDERVINPFFHNKRIPSSRGPYLSVFRRSVQFDSSTRSGLRDKNAYDALLDVLSYIESIDSEEELMTILIFLLYKFVQLREASSIPLSRLQRMSLSQYDSLITKLLITPSGGRFPVLLVVSTFLAIKDYFNLDWEISWQGINVADLPSGVGGDITVKSSGNILMSVEVTERPLINLGLSPLSIQRLHLLG